MPSASALLSSSTDCRFSQASAQTRPWAYSLLPVDLCILLFVACGFLIGNLPDLNEQKEFLGLGASEAVRLTLRPASTVVGTQPQRWAGGRTGQASPGVAGDSSRLPGSLKT